MELDGGGRQEEVSELYVRRCSARFGYVRLGAPNLKLLMGSPNFRVSGFRLTIILCQCQWRRCWSAAGHELV